MKNKDMKALDVIEKTREYLDYVERHIKNVVRAWSELQEKCKAQTFVYDDYRFSILRDEVTLHDLSKLGPEELAQYRRKFYPTDEEAENTGPHDPSHKAFDEAWQHHWENNPHHWENWAGKDYYNPYEAECHCTHMVIDWLAMSYELGDTPRSYYEKNKERIDLPEWAVTYINSLFDELES